MSERVVAYLLPASSGEGEGEYEYGSRFLLGEPGVLGQAAGIRERTQRFASGEECRNALCRLSPAVSIIVCNSTGSVTPINLAAALCLDAPDRDVYLMEDKPTQSLAGRVRAAGIRGILDSSQVQHLMGVEQGIELNVEPAIGPANTLAIARPLPLVAREERGPAPTAIPATAAMPAPTAMPMPAPLAQGRVVGFFSGRGGVGKSAVSLMTGLAARKRGLRVALVDLDLQFGDMGYLSGKEPASKIQRFSIMQLCDSAELPTLNTEAMTLVTAPNQPEQGEQLAPALPRLLEWLATQRDLIVLNTGSFWTDIHAKAVQRCDHLVFLMDQRATSIEACKQAVDLCLRLQVPQARFLFALNGCGRHAALSVQDVSFALGGVQVAGLADGGALVDELLSLGCPVELLSSGNAFVASLEGLLDSLIGHPQRTPSAHALLVDETGHKEKRQAGVFDLSALRNFFGGAYRVAT